jgi:hypothetical protein
MSYKLNVICVYYNFAGFIRRYVLTKEYIDRMLMYNNINLFIVELVSEGDPFMITNKDNKNHLQLVTNTHIWYKENLINIAIEKLLDKNWTNFAWIDSDVKFENDNWIQETIEKLKIVDIVQLFSNCHQLDISNNIIHSTSGIFNYNKNKEKYNYCYNNSHPGYAWAMSANGYNKIGKIPDLFIIGGADKRIACGVLDINYISDGQLEVSDLNITEEYLQYLKCVYNKFKGLSFDYIDCNIFHYYHGDRKNRKYVGRQFLLSEYKYNPFTFFTYNEHGLLIPTDSCNKELLEKIKSYFIDRKEDD